MVKSTIKLDAIGRIEADCFKVPVSDSNLRMNTYKYNKLFIRLAHGIRYAVTTLKQVLGKDDADTSTVDKLGAKAEKKIIRKKVGPEDEFDRGVPRNSVAGYLQAAEKDDFERAANYLDLRRLPTGYSSSDGHELAKQLYIVLNRTLWIDLDILSTDPHGHSQDGLPRSRDLVGVISVGNKHYDILLQRVPRGDGVSIWKFSSKTVSRIPRLYQEHGYSPIGEQLSDILPDYEFLGLELWQWVFLLLIFLAATLATLPVVRLVSWWIRRKQFPLSDLSARFLNGPFNVFLVFMVVRQWFDVIQPSVTARALFEAKTLTIIITAWMLMRLVRLSLEYFTHVLTQHGREHASVLLRPLATAVNVIILLAAIVIWLDNIGVKVTTLLAGLGIGGIAVALATQKTIEQFVGSLTLYIASPVRVGDFCRFGNYLGTVEEIGLRSTRIRTLDHTVVVIPNADFAGMPIENYTERDNYFFKPTISLHIGTSPDQLRYILIEFQKLLHAHPKVAESPVRARFVGFGDHSLDIKIMCYIETTDYGEFLEVGEDLNLRMMDIINEAGTQIAIPAEIEYHSEATQPDPSAKQQAEAKVAQWRDNNDLQLLNLTEKQINDIKNTLAYPSDDKS
jgi:MscS family membrane protein